jgi:uncharacterized membrane protein
MGKKEKTINNLEKVSVKITNWVGTPQSIIAHTIFFLIMFALYFIGVSVDKILLVLTTAVSLEAIYLAIFIQMTVNRNTESLEEFSEDIEDIQEDVEDISEDIEEDDLQDAKNAAILEHIQLGLQKLSQELETLKKHTSV